MTDTEIPIDQARTTRSRAGMVFRDRRELPGLGLVVMAVLALAGFMTAAAVRDTGWATGLGVTALVAAIAGLSWILVGRNRTLHAGKHRRQS